MRDGPVSTAGHWITDIVGNKALSFFIEAARHFPFVVTVVCV
ncbi:MAG: hypothetical protein WCJ81_03775 [bacterium]